jgi:hypothetical protein
LLIYLVCVSGFVACLALGISFAPQAADDAIHLSRFKASVLERHAEKSLLVLGSSILEEGVLPSLLDATLGTKTFNAATPNTSWQLFAYMCERTASHPGVKLAVIELAVPETDSVPLEWSNDAPFERRRVLRFDSLARLFTSTVFARAFDGSEHYGTEYLGALLGQRPAMPIAPVPEFSWSKRAFDPAAPAAEDAPLNAYLACHARLRERHIDAVVVVPPSRASSEKVEAPVIAGLASAIISKAGMTVLDFSHGQNDAALFRDVLHLTRAGASAFTLSLAHALRDVDAVH